MVISPSLALLFRSIPFAALLKCNAFATKDVQSAPDRQINFPIAQSIDELQISNTAPSSGISDRKGAYLCQVADQLLIDAALLSLYIRGVDEELTAVWLEQRDVFLQPVRFHPSCSKFDSPGDIAKSVTVCHLSVATFQPFPTFRQLRSITSLDLSLCSAANTACSRCIENTAEGNRNDVIMTCDLD